MNKLVINYTGREKRWALLQNDKIEKIMIEQPQQLSSVGNIYLGIVTKVLPGMNAAFVDFGEDKGGYLHRDKLLSYIQSNEPKEVKQKRSISTFVHQGERILVQVEKDATGTKGARLSGIIELSGDYLVYMPNGRYVAVSKKMKSEREKARWRKYGFHEKTEEEGLIFRTECENQSEETVQSELQFLRERFSNVNIQAQSMKKTGIVLSKDTFLKEIEKELKKWNVGEVIIDDAEAKKKIESLISNPEINVQWYSKKESIFSAYHLEHEVERALKRIVWLQNGAYLIFDYAEALTIIDVNTGKFSGKNDLEETVLKTNEWAAEEIARQIRLRDLAGMILIDFIDMKSDEERRIVQKRLETELSKDERRTKVIGFTPLGILQLTRKKTKVSLSESLQTKCSVCEGTGMVLSPESIAFQLERELWEHRNSDAEAILIETTLEVKSIFCGDQEIHKKRFEEMIGLRLFFILKDSCKPYYEIRQIGSLSEIERKV